jgi:hypothetical protein
MNRRVVLTIFGTSLFWICVIVKERKTFNESLYIVGHARDKHVERLIGAITDHDELMKILEEFEFDRIALDLE